MDNNIAKYLLVLESIKFEDAAEESNSAITTSRITENVVQLKKFIKQDLAELVASNAQELQVTCPPMPAADDVVANYCIYLEHMLLQLSLNINFDNDAAKEQLISMRHSNLCIEAIQELAKYSLRAQLHPLLLQSASGVFGIKQALHTPHTRSHLQLSIVLFAKLLQIKQFHVANAMQLVLRDYMAAIYTLYTSHALQEFTLSDANLQQLQQQLNQIWLQLTKVEYFRNILMLKSERQLPTAVQQQLHKELLQKLASRDGFSSLVAMLTTAAQEDSSKTAEIVANIVAFKGHSARYQAQMLQQIFKFLKLCLSNAAMLSSMGVALLTLRRLFDLNDANQLLVKAWLSETMQPLSQPVDLLSGLIVLEHDALCALIALHFQLFCTSSVACLPSVLLLPRLPLLLQVFHQLPEAFVTQRQQLTLLITRCLANRTSAELQTLLAQLYKREFCADWQQLHARVFIQPQATQTQCVAKVAPAEFKQDFDIALALPELLLQSDHNTLTFQVFMQLLQLMDNELNAASTADLNSIDLLQSEDELVTFLNAKYPLKIDILLTLNTLVAHDCLKQQLAENASEFLKLLRSLIARRLEPSYAQPESADQTLLIMLTLAQETLEYTQLPERWLDFAPTLKRLSAQTPNELIKQRIVFILRLLEGDIGVENATPASAASAEQFSAARALIESSESHLQVYGIQMLLGLLRAGDAVTLSNKHIIIALALQTLKQRESYTFLNCVRLFVGLINIMEADVLELLSDEYLNEHASLDHRLVVGEAILKVSKELGQLCYKYKDVLLNCFMQGARSQIQEFRWSSFSNLSQLCRTLSYQVHKFFNELINLINCELTTGQYMPAKRAAVLVISELLEGMDNLMDFEEMLLPLYRLLKVIEADETYDAKMRLHAANGLKALAEKCKQLLFPQAVYKKEIQILGIKETKSTHRKSPHILELN